MTSRQERTIVSDADQPNHSLEAKTALNPAESRVSNVEDSVEQKWLNTCSSLTKKRPNESVGSKDGKAKYARFGNGPTRTEFVWTEETHRAFVSAVYHIGMKHASPAVILENMHTMPISITSERVKSHLQKYRLNRSKGKEEFMSGYDNWMTKAIRLSNKSESSRNITAQPSFILDMMSSTLPVPGDIAAFLSYSVIMESKQGADSGNILNSQVDSQTTKVDDDYVQYFTGASITFPRLSEEEKLSTLGKGLCYIMALFVNMTEHLDKVRRENTVNDDKSDFINGQRHQYIDSSSIESGPLAIQRDLLPTSTSRTPRASSSIPRHSNQAASAYYAQHQLDPSDLNSYEHRQSIQESASHSLGSSSLTQQREAVPMSNTRSFLASDSIPPQSHHQTSQYYSQPQHFDQTGDYHLGPSTFYQPPHAPATDYERSPHPTQFQHSSVRYPPPPEPRSSYLPYGKDHFNPSFESDHAPAEVDLPLPEAGSDTSPWNVPRGVFNDHHR